MEKIHILKSWFNLHMLAEGYAVLQDASRLKVSEVSKIAGHKVKQKTQVMTRNQLGGGQKQISNVR